MIRPVSENEGVRARLCEAALALALLGTFFVVAPIPDVSLDRFQLPKELILALAALVAVGAAPRVRHVDAVDAGLLAVMLTSMVSAALAIEPWTAVRLASLTLAGASAAFAARRLPPAAHERLRHVALGGLAVLAALVLAETFGGLRGLSGYGRAPAATLGQRNAVAHVLVIGLPFAWRAAFVGARPPTRLLGLAASALFAGAVVASRSRAAWIAAALALLVMLVVHRRVWHAALLAGCATIAGALVVPATRPSLSWHASRPYLDTFRRLLDVDAGSGLGRMTQYVSSLELVPRAPLWGVGPGGWAIAYPLVSPPGDPSFRADEWEPTGRLLTSDVIATLVERGVLGVVAVGALAFALVRAMRASPDAELRRAWLASAVALGCVASLDSVLQLAAPLALCSVLFAVPVAAVVPVVAAVPVALGARRLVLARVARAALVVCLILAVAHRTVQLCSLSLRASERATSADLERARALDPGDYPSRAALAETFLRRRDCDAALLVLDEALALRPYHPVVVATHRAAAACASRPPSP